MHTEPRRLADIPDERQFALGGRTPVAHEGRVLQILLEPLQQTVLEESGEHADHGRRPGGTRRDGRGLELGGGEYQRA
ncbi:hypothetical protein ABZ467_37780 [Streptomyces sp. NPDC005727]|uniref:hypothetical protein n=1 Tax=Streptomyces sp. NPDC005727 TaxID=3157053 RepID=UPI003404EE37